MKEMAQNEFDKEEMLKLIIDQNANKKNGRKN